jgi:hypothetical protein
MCTQLIFSLLVVTILHSFLVVDGINIQPLQFATMIASALSLQHNHLQFNIITVPSGLAGKA